jgi:lantibiotic modifying enzyme
MHLSDPLRVSSSMTHRPWCGQEAPSVQAHFTELIAGFKEMYAHLMESRHRLLGDRNTLAMFDDLDPRVLLRGTATYTRMQLRLLHPEFMASGIDRSIELEWFARLLSGPSSRRSDRQRIYDQERDALERLDVPTFTSAFGDLVSDDDSDPDLAFLRAPRNASFVEQRLAQLSIADCDRQVQTITQAIEDHFMGSSPRR